MIQSKMENLGHAEFCNKTNAAPGGAMEPLLCRAPRTLLVFQKVALTAPPCPPPRTQLSPCSSPLSLSLFCLLVQIVH